MNRRTARAASLVLTAALVLTGCAVTGTGSDGMDGMHHDSESSAEFNAADVMFAQMMIPHHEQAVEMSDTILAKEGIDEEVARLARDIKAAQQPEIEQLEDWLADWDAAMPGMGEMGHGGGMMSEADMADLESAEGVDASILFLEQMTVHHEGAIDMAQDEVDDGLQPEVVEMARSITETQTAEIAVMRELLANL